MTIKRHSGWRWGGANVSHLHEIVCMDCGEIFEAKTTTARRCPICRPLHDEMRREMYQREQSEKRSQHSAQVQWHQRQYELEHDPSGDFRPGSRFSDVELAAMLKIGNWSLGTRFHNRKTGGRFVVIAGEDPAALALRRVI